MFVCDCIPCWCSYVDGQMNYLIAVIKDGDLLALTKINCAKIAIASKECVMFFDGGNSRIGTMVAEEGSCFLISAEHNDDDIVGGVEDYLRDHSNG